MPRPFRTAWISACLVTTLVSCKPAAAPPPPPPAVKVATVLQQDVPVYLEAIGEARGNTEIEIRARVEGFLADAAPAPAGSQALAEMLREALASNTIGGKAGEEAKWRAMADEVRQAQASWSRLGPVPGDTGRQLTERFHKTCNRFFEQLRRKVPPTQAQPPRGRPVGAR